MITILTDQCAYHFESDDWARDDGGDVHVYDDQRCLATFDADAFVAALNELPADKQRALVADHMTTIDNA